MCFVINLMFFVINFVIKYFLHNRYKLELQNLPEWIKRNQNSQGAHDTRSHRPGFLRIVIFTITPLKRLVRPFILF